MDLDTAESTATTLPETAPLKVAVILASNREGRFAPVIADWFLAHTDAHPAIGTDVVDVAGLDLPTALSFRPEPAAREVLAGVSARLAEADAFVVVTPEYNHSYPAPLKNLIDWHRDEWQAKPVAFVSYGGVSGGLRAVEHLRQVFAELHSVSIRDTVSFHNAGAQFDDEGRHRDPAGPDAAVKTLLDQLVWWGRALRDAKRAHPYGG
ncbi:NAD(P)H-dependent oxidoreductase [Streptomyces sp. SID9727]|uniref:NADPH-dependent FMN reductase n=1 Tax=Streptomyces sp. SID9727 TaxID=2706114 RepID=UPI0013CD49E2|nr:NAD(P)H-dependent oxidoreductase [Streptomyces sp. SID9727]NEC64824.1 NAD(P)H-dependent oxidoreductase [Streptomyces sp. SID9727]